MEDPETYRSSEFATNRKLLPQTQVSSTGDYPELKKHKQVPLSERQGQ